MEQKIKILEELKDRLCNWKSYDETRLQKLMKEFEKIPREEFSSFFTPILTDKSLIENIGKIGEAFQSNSEILVNVISSLGNIVWRYKLDPSVEMFDFFKKAAKNKKVNYYVSLYITSFPQYNTWKDRWNYLISIPEIAPKKKSIVNFHTEVKKILNTKEDIPLEVINKIITILSSQINSNFLSDYTKNDYLNTISLLEKQMKQ
ncbi:hypothetical protein HQ40_08450 [Porphyromonas gulae]|uniref:hypothetical protein n=1 Tax=Porphyromonas gulae TaxID=111105 RepID=UPI00052DC961|nr:hypothetical protein [Porphyromonas gulae]KGN73820.1 hypothetical protein HQ40_08450 [Porphyromonas gulae]